MRANTDIEARVTELEIKLGFAEDLIDALNQTVYRQQQQIDGLLQALAQLSRRIPDEPGASRSLRDELPPHY